MSDRIDILDASYDAVRIELEKTQRVIEFLERRATKLREALGALDNVVNGSTDVIDLQSVTRVMDQLQQSARKAAEAGEDGAPVPDGAASGEGVPGWLKEDDVKTGAATQ